jgi:guanylate kinase
MISELDVEYAKKILGSYRVSDHAKQVLKLTKLLPFVAPTSVGRNTVINLLIEKGNYHFIRSDTTRPSRVNNGTLEQNGREYWFRSPAEFIEELKKGEFVEAALIHNQQLSGINIRELEIAAADNKIAVTDLEIVGTKNLHKLKPDLIAIFLLPPDFDEWMKRLRDRGFMAEDEQLRRLNSAVTELQEAISEDYYQFVVNDHLSQAVEQIQEIVRIGHNLAEAQNKGRDLAIQLRQTLIDQLDSKK